MASRWSLSLRRYLLLGILVPTGVFMLVNTVTLYRQALAAVNTAYDRTLLASAKSLGELLEVEGQGAQARFRTNVPYSALEAFEAAAAVTLAAWSAPGALVGNTPLPVGFEVPAVMAAGINFFDTLVHGWDLRMALGLDAEMPAHLAEAALAVTQTIVSADVRALVGFDPERRPMDAGSATERLVAFLGRPTSWR